MRRDVTIVDFLKVIESKVSSIAEVENTEKSYELALMWVNYYFNQFSNVPVTVGQIINITNKCWNKAIARKELQNA